jgi:hypothetical protein
LKIVEDFKKETGWEFVLTDTPHLLLKPEIQSHRIILNVGWVLSSNMINQGRRIKYLYHNLNIIRSSINLMKIASNEQRVDSKSSVSLPATADRPSSETPRASSPVEQVLDREGGIDFRALPIVTQPLPSVPGTGAPGTSAPEHQLSVATSARVTSALVSQPSTTSDSEWLQIQNMIQAGIIPSADRIKQYLQALCQNDSMDQQIDNVLACIADILRMEEERCCETEPSVRDMLALLESGKSDKELVSMLSSIEILAKEPVAIE